MYLFWCDIESHWKLLFFAELISVLSVKCNSMICWGKSCYIKTSKWNHNIISLIKNCLKTFLKCFCREIQAKSNYVEKSSFGVGKCFGFSFSAQRKLFLCERISRFNEEKMFFLLTRKIHERWKNLGKVEESGKGGKILKKSKECQNWEEKFV